MVWYGHLPFRQKDLEMTVYLLFALQAGTYTLKIKFGEIR